MDFRGILAISVALSFMGAIAAPARPLSERAADANAKAAPVAAAAYAPNEAPIVSGRSVLTHHKSKMHHIRVRPDEALDAPGAAAAN